MAKIKTKETKKCESLTQEELEKVVKYFEKPATWPWILVACGLLVFFGGLWILLGLALCGLGVWLLYDAAQKRVTDSEFDAIRQKAFAMLHCVAMEKLGVDEGDTVRDNELVWGPRYYDRGDAILIFKEGDDGVVRYSLYNIVVLVFTKKHLAMYQCALDMQTGNRLNECTEEFFYKDVVSVGTGTKTNTLLEEDETFTFIGKKSSQVVISQKNAWESFELRNAGGGVIYVPIRSDAVLKQMGGRFEESQVDRIVNSMRAILRDKK